MIHTQYSFIREKQLDKSRNTLSTTHLEAARRTSPCARQPLSSAPPVRCVRTRHAHDLVARRISVQADWTGPTLHRVGGEHLPRQRSQDLGGEPPITCRGRGIALVVATRAQKPQRPRVELGNRRVSLLEAGQHLVANACEYLPERRGLRVRLVAPRQGRRRPATLAPARVVRDDLAAHFPVASIAGAWVRVPAPTQIGGLRYDSHQNALPTYLLRAPIARLRAPPTYLFPGRAAKRKNTR